MQLTSDTSFKTKINLICGHMVLPGLSKSIDFKVTYMSRAVQMVSEIITC